MQKIWLSIFLALGLGAQAGATQLLSGQLTQGYQYSLAAQGGASGTGNVAGSVPYCWSTADVAEEPCSAVLPLPVWEPSGVTANPPAINSGTPIEVTANCGTTSAIVLAAGAAASSVSFHLPAGSLNPVWLNFAGTVATLAPPGFDLWPGHTLTFTAQSGLLPTASVSCIATAATSIVEIYK